MTTLDTAPSRPKRSVNPLSSRRAQAARSLGDELAALGWQKFGSCRKADASLFFAPDISGEPAGKRLRRLVAAKRVCAGCPVRETCRGYALDNGEEFGVWGGLSEVERKQIRAEQP
jgi:WhiB family redox-sensing transcriptional regulator